MSRSRLDLPSDLAGVIGGSSAVVVAFDELDIVAIFGGEHVEMQQQPVGFVLDRLREAGFAPGFPECGEWPVIDMDRYRLASLGIDADQADDGAVVGDAIDADA